LKPALQLNFNDQNKINVLINQIRCFVHQARRESFKVNPEAQGNKTNE